MPPREMVKEIEGPDRLEILQNPNYRRILSIMRNEELTVKEIHKRFNEDYEDKKSKTTIYRYMEKLEENDFVFVSNKKVKRGHLIEKHYSRTARFFISANRWSRDEVFEATAELCGQIYDLDADERAHIREVIQELGEKLSESRLEFYERYGEPILKGEEKYGFQIIKEAAHLMHRLTYFREHSELYEQVFEILEG